MRVGASLAGLLLAAAAVACAAKDPAPAALDASAETCRSCRMPVSDRRLAAQLAAPGEEAVFFDDIGCLRDYLKARPAAPNAVAYVAEHRTGSWIRSTAAVYSRCPGLATPMGSHLIAHSDALSRDADASAAGCVALTAQEVFGASPPDGRTGGD